MPSSSPLRAAAIGLGFVLVAWSAATAAGCGSGGAMSTTTGSGTTGSGGSSSSVTSSSTTSGTGGHKYATCDACLSATCTAEEAACDTECHSIQACLDAVCVNLSATMSTEEGACQAHCQGLHPTGKAAHVKLVTCAHTTVCEPPCVPYSFDYDTCVKAEVMGECKPAFDACNASTDCVAYQTCASKCTKLADCLGCAMVPGGDMGEKLYEASQLCIEKKCIAEGWLPSF